MGIESEGSWTAGCLDHDLLVAYDMGRMSEALLERVAEHLASCNRCMETLESIHGEKDILLRNLQRYVPGTPSLAELNGETNPEGAPAAIPFLDHALAGLGPLPRRFGPYELLEKLGQGGMAVVFKARQLRPDRLVALKVPLCLPLSETDVYKRFQIETKAVARLEHENIVRIYECGEQEGFPYFSMEYMDAGSLAQRLSGAPMPAREAAHLVFILARAVHFAHQHGVVHRDIKPANVLLGATGALKLTDFGLAKLLDAAANETKTAAILGTAKYMAPEQAEARLGDIGPHTDVYGLGVILYELVTGRPPFQGDTDLKIRAQIVTAEPVPPRRLRPEVPRDLETICLKCLQKAPRKRYASAAALADDLQRFREGRPVAVRPVGQAEQLWRWCCRKPAVAALLASLACVFWAGFAGVAWQWRVAVAATEEKELQRQQAETAREWSERLVYAGQIALAQREWQDNDVAHARELLDACLPGLRGWEHAYLRRLFYSNQQTLQGHTNYVHSAAFSPDSRRLVSGSWDRTLKIWDARTGQAYLTLTGHTGPVLGVAFSPDGKRIASASDDGTVKVWDAQTGQAIRTLKGHTGHVMSVAFSPNGKHLVSGGEDGTVRLWNLENGQQDLTVHGHKGCVHVAFSPNGKHVASEGSDRVVKIWDIRTGKETFTLKGHTGAGSYFVTFSPDGKQLAGISSDHTMTVWNLETGQEHATLKGHTSVVTSAGFSPDGRRIVTGSEDRMVNVWDAQTGERIRTLRGHTASVNHVTYSPDGRRIASASCDGTLKVWDADTDQEAVTLKGHTQNIWGVAFSRDGKRLAIACVDGWVKVWDANTRRPLLSFQGHDGVARCVAFSPDGRRLVSGSENRELKVWDAETGQHLLTLVGHTDGVRGVAFSPDSQRIVSAARHEGTLKVWDAANGQEILTLKGHPEGVWSVAYSPDGKRIVSGGDDNLVKVWDSQTGQELLILKGHTKWVMSVAYSTDGQRIVSSGKDRAIKVWDAETGNHLLTLKGHTDDVTSIAFSLDGKRLASGSDDGTVKLWDAQTGLHLLTLKGHSDDLRSVAFSPDGKRLMSASRDGMVKLWETETR